MCPSLDKPKNTKNKIEIKREREKEMVSQMIALYCKKHHHTEDGSLCQECAELDAYAQGRSDKCPFMETKTFCANCQVHCYKPQMRQKIQEVMRFCGPRMLFHHPIAAIHHLISTKREKYRLKQKMPLKKVLWAILGCLGVALGALGAVLPLLPAFPFLLLAAISFGKSSERLENWFKGTNLYKENLESYVSGQGMTWKTKRKVMMMVTLLMTIGFAILLGHNLYVGCLILILVWVFHLVYFMLGVKTIKEIA